MPQDPVGSQSATPAPYVASPVIGTRLLTVEHDAPTLFGVRLGSPRRTTLQLTVTLGAGCTVERVDGKPLGDLAERCREQIEAARLALEERLRRGGSANLRRTQAAAEPTPEAPAPSAPRPPADQRVTSSVFRCERKVITDRISKLRQEVAPPASPAALAEAERRAEQQRTRERLAELRRQYWESRREPEVDGLEPSPAPDAGGETPRVGRTTTSVFRVDRESITDRIGRLRRKPDLPDPGPAAQDPPPGGGTAPAAGDHEPP